MCNENRFSESGAPIAPTRCAEYGKLKAQNEVLRDEIEAIKHEHQEHCAEAYNNAVRQITARKEENARLLEALKFYADKYNYTHCYVPGGDNIINVDGGETARNALKEVG